VIAVPGHDAIVLHCPPSPPIGSHLTAHHLDATHELVPGATIACYTDGLIERRSESIDLGLERLRAAFRAGHPERVCASVMAQLIGSADVEDDTALLVFRRDA
jgi:serine phosphatase RsbU (regulator of sigma subunit)